MEGPAPQASEFTRLVLEASVTEIGNPHAAHHVLTSKCIPYKMKTETSFPMVVKLAGRTNENQHCIPKETKTSCSFTGCGAMASRFSSSQIRVTKKNKSNSKMQ